MSLAEQEREVNNTALKVLSFSPVAPDADLHRDTALEYLTLAMTNLELARRFYNRARRKMLSGKFLSISHEIESLRSTLAKE